MYIYFLTDGPDDRDFNTTYGLSCSKSLENMLLANQNRVDPFAHLNEATSSH